MARKKTCSDLPVDRGEKIWETNKKIYFVISVDTYL